MYRLRKMRSGLSCESNFHERQKTGYQPEDLHSLFLLPGVLPEGSNESRENDSNEDCKKDLEIAEVRECCVIGVDSKNWNRQSNQ